MTAVALARLFRDGGYQYASEVDLHHRLEQVMRDAGYDPAPEARIVGGRVDFLVDGTGIEVKVSGTPDALLRQITRYAADPQVRDLLVVTTIHRHTHLPRKVGGKPVEVVQLGGIL